MTPIEFKARRIRLGLGQADLGRLLSVKQSSISRWENGVGQIPVGIALGLEALEDAWDDLVDRLTIEAESDADATITATATVEDVGWPAGMVLSAAASAFWLLNGEAEEDGLEPRAHIV